MTTKLIVSRSLLLLNLLLIRELRFEVQTFVRCFTWTMVIFPDIDINTELFRMKTFESIKLI